MKPGISYSSQPFQGEKQVGLGESLSPLQMKEYFDLSLHNKKKYKNIFT